MFMIIIQVFQMDINCILMKYYFMFLIIIHCISNGRYLRFIEILFNVMIVIHVFQKYCICILINETLFSCLWSCYVPDVKKGWYRNIYVRQLLLGVVRSKKIPTSDIFHSQKSLLVALRKNTNSYKNKKI